MAGRPRKQLPMSDEEIRREYRLAKNPAKQIKILADENDVSRETIRRIVCEKPSPPPKLSGFVPFQELAEKQKEKEKDNMPEDESIPLRVSAEGELPSETPTWHPLPSAPPQAAADFDDAPAAAGPPHQSAAPTASPEGTPLEGEPGPSSLPDVQDLPEAGTVTGLMKLRAAERRYFLTEPQLMELWFILGKLQGVLDAAAEAGKPGEVMKDAVDELESLLRSLS